jgi:hypothetical protein
MSCPVLPSRLQILKGLLVPFAVPPKHKNWHTSDHVFSLCLLGYKF